MLRASQGHQSLNPVLEYDPAQALPALKPFWLARDQLCSKLLKAVLDPSALKKSIEAKLKVFSTPLGNLNREATKA